jgi:hypothetical protein
MSKAAAAQSYSCAGLAQLGQKSVTSGCRPGSQLAARIRYKVVGHATGCGTTTVRSGPLRDRLLQTPGPQEPRAARGTGLGSVAIVEGFATQ